MSRKSVSLDAQISDYCDKAVSVLRKFGIPSYRSRADYIEQACIKQLEKDGIISEKQATQKKKVVEEVSA